MTKRKKKTPVFVSTGPQKTDWCPSCFARLDAAMGMSLEASDPRPRMTVGDMTKCLYCGALLTCTVDGFRPATDEEIAQIDPELRAVFLSFPTVRGRTEQ